MKSNCSIAPSKSNDRNPRMAVEGTWRLFVLFFFNFVADFEVQFNGNFWEERLCLDEKLHPALPTQDHTKVSLL